MQTMNEMTLLFFEDYKNDIHDLKMTLLFFDYDFF